MKKIYMTPEMETVEIKVQQMLATSMPLSETEVTDESDILAPGLDDDDLSVFGL